jgi:hypothetical protein
MSKKLPAQLQKVLEQHKQRWLIDNDELAKRLSNATAQYTKALPPLGNDKDFSQIVLFAPTFTKVLEQLHQSKWADYTIDYKRTIAANGSYKVFLNKPLSLQDKELARIEREVKTQYQNELDEIKESFIDDLLSEYEQQRAVEKADKEADNEQQLKQSLLSLLD